MTSMFSINGGMSQGSNYFQSINKQYGCGEIDFGKVAYQRPYAIEVTPRNIKIHRKENLLELFYRKFIK